MTTFYTEFFSTFPTDPSDPSGPSLPRRSSSLSQPSTLFLAKFNIFFLLSHPKPTAILSIRAPGFFRLFPSLVFFLESFILIHRLLVRLSSYVLITSLVSRRSLIVNHSMIHVLRVLHILRTYFGLLYVSVFLTLFPIFFAFSPIL